MINEALQCVRTKRKVYGHRFFMTVALVVMLAALAAISRPASAAELVAYPGGIYDYTSVEFVDTFVWLGVSPTTYMNFSSASYSTVYLNVRRGPGGASNLEVDCSLYTSGGATVYTGYKTNTAPNTNIQVPMARQMSSTVTFGKCWVPGITNDATFATYNGATYGGDYHDGRAQVDSTSTPPPDVPWIDEFTLSDTTPDYWQEVTGHVVADSLAAVKSVVFSIDDEELARCDYEGPAYASPADCEVSLGVFEVQVNTIDVVVTGGDDLTFEDSIGIVVGDSVDPRDAPILQLDSPITGGTYQSDSDVFFHVRTSVPWPIINSAPVLYALKVEKWDDVGAEWLRPSWQSGNIVTDGDLGFTDAYGTQHYYGEPPFGCFGGTCNQSLIFNRYSYGEPPAAAYLGSVKSGAYRISARVKFNGFEWSEYSPTVSFSVGEIAYEFQGGGDVSPCMGRIDINGQCIEAEVTDIGGDACDVANAGPPRFKGLDFPAWVEISDLGRWLGKFALALFVPTGQQFDDVGRVAKQFLCHFPIKPMVVIWDSLKGVYDEEAVRQSEEPAACPVTAMTVSEVLCFMSKERIYWTIQQAYLWELPFGDSTTITLGDLLIFGIYFSGLIFVIYDWKEMAAPD